MDFGVEPLLLHFGGDPGIGPVHNGKSTYLPCNPNGLAKGNCNRDSVKGTKTDGRSMIRWLNG